MSASKADNAMMAKVHCLYGRRIKPGDYDRLLQKRSVAEIAGYLKTETYYSDALSEVKEDLVHREQLENLMHRSIWDIYLRLIKYSYADKLFLKMHIKQMEIRQILFAIRLINAGAMNQFIVSLPVYLTKHMNIDLFAIARAKDYDDLLSALVHSEYYQLLGRFRPITAGKQANITSCETALLKYYFAKMLELVRGNYRGSMRDNLIMLINYQIDLHNVSVIYRMKRYFRASRQTVESHLIDIHARLSSKAYDEMLEARELTSVAKIFGGSRVSKFFSGGADDDSMEHMFFVTQRIKRYLSQKVLRFSSEPVVVMYCYMMLLDIEVNNVTNIIEGTRYNVSPNEIRNMLVF